MSSFDLVQLRYFVQAVKDRNISSAASNLYVSHQALSKSILILEDALGIQLLERSKTGVMPTEFGRVFYKEACDILRRVDRLDDICKSHRCGIDDTAHMGIIPGCLASNGGTIHAEDLLGFQQLHPAVSCVFKDISSENIEAEFDKGIIDLATSMDGFDRSRFDHTLLWEFPMAVVMSSLNPLAHATSVSLEDLADKELVVITEYRENFARMCDLYDFRPRISPLQTSLSWDEQTIHESDMLIIYMLQHSRRVFKQGIKSDLVSIVPIIQNGDPVIDPLFLIWRKDDELRGARRELRDFIVDLYRRTHPLSPRETLPAKKDGLRRIADASETRSPERQNSTH